MTETDGPSRIYKSRKSKPHRVLRCRARRRVDFGLMVGIALATVSGKAAAGLSTLGEVAAVEDPAGVIQGRS